MYQVPYVIEDTGRGERAMDIYSTALERPDYLFRN